MGRLKDMKKYQITCLDHGGKLHKVAIIEQTTPRKAKEAGRRFAKLMGLKFHEAKLQTNKLHA